MLDKQLNTLIFESVIYNCSAYIEQGKDGIKVVKGNPTEAGLINYLTQSGDVRWYFE